MQISWHTDLTKWKQLLNLMEDDQGSVHRQIIFWRFRRKAGVMSDFIGVFFMECSCYHIKNSLKTFQKIDYPLIIAEPIIIIYCSQHAFTARGHPPCATTPRQLRLRATGARNSEWWSNLVFIQQMQRLQESLSNLSTITFSLLLWTGCSSRICKLRRVLTKFLPKTSVA